MRIIIQSGTQVGQTFELTKNIIGIGRGSQNDLVVSDPTASRNHCQIRYEAAGWTVYDMGGVNGTLVNNQPVRGARLLRPGDTITLGQTSLRVEDSPAASAMPASTAPEYMPPAYAQPARGGNNTVLWVLLGAGVIVLFVVGILVAVMMFGPRPPTPPQTVAGSPFPTGALPTATPTLTPNAPQPTATIGVCVNCTATPVTSRVPSPTPIITPYPLPNVLLPKVPNNQFRTSDPVPFNWIGVAALRQAEVYRVQIALNDKFDDNSIACIIRTRETYVTAPGPNAACNDKWQFNQNYQYYWRVEVVAPGADGNFIPLHAEAAPINTFTWAP